MATLDAAELLAALGHESRLAIFRLLVEAGPEGMNASAIGDRLGIPLTLAQGWAVRSYRATRSTA